MREIKAPHVWGNPDQHTTIFIAGSIEMGLADNWQTKLCKELHDLDVILLNPRRDDWDSSWRQSINDTKFKEQVTWELKNLEGADLVVFYFDPNTKSPITLLELGLVVGTHFRENILVCCPDGFWRKGNVEIICDRYKVRLVNTFENLVTELKELI